MGILLILDSFEILTLNFLILKLTDGIENNRKVMQERELELSTSESSPADMAPIQPPMSKMIEA